MYKIWCYCGYQKRQDRPSRLRCPRCGGRLQCTVLDEVKKIKKAGFKYIPPSRAPERFVPKVRDEITVYTVQGIGDIFWIYQKLAPYFKKINLFIYILEKSVQQMRAEYFLKLLPKIAKVEYEIVTPTYYGDFAKREMYLTPILYDIAKNNRKHVEFVCNRFLEKGVRLEKIDPYLKTYWNIHIKTGTCKLPFKKYLLVYISGGTCAKAMSIGKWVDLFMFYEKIFGKFPIVFIGASYDKERIEKVYKRLSGRKHIVIDAQPKNVCAIIKNARFFIGIQSGLCILADNFDVPQLMIYVSWLEKLIYSWPKYSNIEQGKYTPVFEYQPVEEMVKAIQRRNI